MGSVKEAKRKKFAFEKPNKTQSPLKGRKPLCLEVSSSSSSSSSSNEGKLEPDDFLVEKEEGKLDEKSSQPDLNKLQGELDQQINLSTPKDFKRSKTFGGFGREKPLSFGNLKPSNFFKKEPNPADFNLVMPKGLGTIEKKDKILSIIKSHTKTPSIRSIHASRLHSPHAQPMPTIEEREEENKETKKKRGDWTKKEDLNLDAFKEKDFQGLRGQVQIERLLEGFVDDQPASETLSDLILIYENNAKKNEKLLLLTAKWIYLLELDFHLIKAFPVISLVSLKFPEKHAGLFCIQIENGQELIIESYRRFDVSVFLIAACKKAGMPPLLIKNYDQDLFANPNSSIYIDLASGERAPEAQPMLKMSPCIGWLFFYETSFLGRQKWTRFFCVLSSLGLLAFENDKVEPVYFPKKLRFIESRIPCFIFRE